jgi:hypothetical protein
MARAGIYTVRLTVDGTPYTTRVRVTNDPRIHAAPGALAAQADLQLKIYRGVQEAWEGSQQATSLRDSLAADTAASIAPEVSAAARSLIARIDSVAGAENRNAGGGNPFRRFGNGPQTFFSLNGWLVRQLDAQDLADMAPTAAMLAAWQAGCHQLGTAVTGWNAIRNGGLAGFNSILASHQMAAVPVAGSDLPAPPCGTPGSPAGTRGRTKQAVQPAGSAHANTPAEDEECDKDDPDCGN